MGQVKGNWLTGAHSGRACRHDDIYTRVDSKTGKCYSCKLCNPSESVTEAQVTQRTNFGAISAAISAWIKTEREANSADYQRVKKAFDRQKRYGTLRGYMMARGMATIGDDGSITINVNVSTTPVINGGGSGNTSGGGSDNGGGGSDNSGGGSDNSGGGSGIGEPEYE